MHVERILIARSRIPEERVIHRSLLGPLPEIAFVCIRSPCQVFRQVLDITTAYRKEEETRWNNAGISKEWNGNFVTRVLSNRRAWDLAQRRENPFLLPFSSIGRPLSTRCFLSSNSALCLSSCSFISRCLA